MKSLVIRKRSVGLSLAALGLWLAAVAPSHAALFDFSYLYNGDTLAGTVDGTLLGDNNTVAVNSIPVLTFNGEARPSVWCYSQIFSLFNRVFPMRRHPG